MFLQTNGLKCLPPPSPSSLLTHFSEQLIRFCGLSCLHNDPGEGQKNRSGADFPPLHEQPNLGKRVSVNLCHNAGLRIPIVPPMESSHVERAFKRVCNILCPYRNICICGKISFHLACVQRHTHMCTLHGEIKNVIGLA